MNWSNVFHLGVKEFRSLKRDTVMLVLIVTSFSVNIYVAATGYSVELHNASIGIIDEDRSSLSLRLRQAFLRPHFHEPVLLTHAETDAGMDRGQYSFVLVVPRGFQSDVARGYHPSVQLVIDATVVMQAGVGAGYISSIVAQEVARYLRETGRPSTPLPRLTVRYAFNPNVESGWFTGIMEIINHVNMLIIILTGAALIREREHGTLEHLMAMPLSPFEVIAAKVWASGLVVLVATGLSLTLVVRAMLGIPVAGSVSLFLCGTALYLFFASALGIFLGMLARTMPRFGQLTMLVILPMMLLSGGQTPLESQPPLLQAFMRLVPSTHYVSFAQAILYRGAGLDIVWKDFVAVFVVGVGLFALAVARFRLSLAEGTGEG